MPAPVLHHAVVDALGQAIVDGEYAAGDSLLLEGVMARCDCSRSVARESLRVLETLGMVAVARRVGTVVQDRSRWRVSNPRVIHWRVSGAHRDEELMQLMELRLGLEPVAARLVALRRPAEVGARLLDLAERMKGLGTAGLGRSEDFLRADVEFHRLVFDACGNDQIAAFSEAVETLLVERNRLGVLGSYPAAEAMDLHCTVARAVIGGDGPAAEAASRGMVGVISHEIGVDPAELETAART